MFGAGKQQFMRQIAGGIVHVDAIASDPAIYSSHQRKMSAPYNSRELHLYWPGY
jgi:hypothetical protein